MTEPTNAAAKETTMDASNKDIMEEEKKSADDDMKVSWHPSAKEEDTDSEASDDDDDDDAELSSDDDDEKPIITTRVPFVSLSSGLQQKASPLELHSWVALVLTLDGRDKITKVFQYSARTLAWWFLGTNQAQRFNALKVSLTTSRKAYRLGRSLIEFQRLRSMGLLETLGWHLQRHSADETPPTNPKALYRRASSNIGWGPVTLQEESSGTSSRRLLRSLSSVAYRMYRPMASTLAASGQASKLSSTPMWKLVGSALKMLGLFGFWTADNVAFLTSSGLFDDLRLDATARMAVRKSLQTRASQVANRSYFVGAIAGLVVNIRSYVSYRNNTLRPLQQQVDQAEDEEEEEMAQQALERAKERQFTLFLALLKSCCDVLVFSNNPGIDFWKKQRGKKMHEGLHCLCGLLSASTVIYNNFPNASK